MVIKQTLRNVVGVGLSLVALSALMLLTRPSESNLGLSFAPLIFLWLLVYYSGGIVVDVVFKNARKRIARALRAVVASSVTLLAMFNALGNVSALDTVVLILLAALGSFYVTRI